MNADDAVFRVVDAGGAEAVDAMRTYFAELDERFEGGFEIGTALDDAVDGMNPPTGRFVVADLGGRVVACGGVTLIDPSTAEIKRMWVDASVRGIGLGRRMLSRLERDAADLGATRVLLDTNRVLTQAIRMYTDAGYHPTDRYNDNPYAHHWFTKPL
ncbi:MAG: GNAT family N-acetyltransferase [Acidimicrobiales bacterium]